MIKCKQWYHWKKNIILLQYEFQGTSKEITELSDSKEMKGQGSALQKSTENAVDAKSFYGLKGTLNVNK